MGAVELIGAAFVLVGAVAAGTVAHELSHAAVLWAFGVPCDVEWLPGREGGGPLATAVSGGWARVTPRALPRGLPSWGLRAAALAPLLLAAPFALVPVGGLPDPFRVGGVYLHAAAVGWLACALPSPQDFSLFWYAERALAEHAHERAGDSERS